MALWGPFIPGRTYPLICVGLQQLPGGMEPAVDDGPARGLEQFVIDHSYEFEIVQQPEESEKKSRSVEHGGLGIVYHAVLQGTHFAIKCLGQDCRIPDASNLLAKYISRMNDLEPDHLFYEEMRSLKSLRNTRYIMPIVVLKLQLANINDRFFCYLMPWCRPLSQLVGETFVDTNRSTLTPEMFIFLLRVVWQVSKGLVAVHKKHKVHLDIKPENVFLDDVGNALIGDFGSVARLDRTLTLSYHPCTLRYAAPEQIKSPYVKTDKSDVYSLSILLGDILDSPANPALAALKQQVADMLSRLSELQTRAHQENPDLRPESSELATSLQALVCTIAQTWLGQLQAQKEWASMRALLDKESDLLGSEHVERQVHKAMEQIRSQGDWQTMEGWLEWAGCQLAPNKHKEYLAFLWRGKMGNTAVEIHHPCPCQQTGDNNQHCRLIGIEAPSLLPIYRCQRTGVYPHIVTGPTGANVWSETPMTDVQLIRLAVAARKMLQELSSRNLWVSSIHPAAVCEAGGKIAIAPWRAEFVVGLQATDDRQLTRTLARLLFCFWTGKEKDLEAWTAGDIFYAGKACLGTRAYLDNFTDELRHGMLDPVGSEQLVQRLATVYKQKKIDFWRREYQKSLQALQTSIDVIATPRLRTSQFSKAYLAIFMTAHEMSPNPLCMSEAKLAEVVQEINAHLDGTGVIAQTQDIRDTGEIITEKARLALAGLAASTHIVCRFWHADEWCDSRRNPLSGLPVLSVAELPILQKELEECTGETVRLFAIHGDSPQHYSLLRQKNSAGFTPLGATPLTASQASCVLEKIGAQRRRLATLLYADIPWPRPQCVYVRLDDNSLDVCVSWLDAEDDRESTQPMPLSRLVAGAMYGSGFPCNLLQIPLLYEKTQGRTVFLGDDIHKILLQEQGEMAAWNWDWAAVAIKDCWQREFIEDIHDLQMSCVYKEIRRLFGCYRQLLQNDPVSASTYDACKELLAVVQKVRKMIPGKGL